MDIRDSLRRWWSINVKTHVRRMKWGAVALHQQHDMWWSKMLLYVVSVITWQSVYTAHHKHKVRYYIARSPKDAARYFGHYNSTGNTPVPVIVNKQTFWVVYIGQAEYGAYDTEREANSIFRW